MMDLKKGYQYIERKFERITSIVSSILGNSITFIIALGIVVFWLSNRDFSEQSLNDTIRDFIYGISFLTLFIIQKSFNHFSVSLHVKLNELLASDALANNTIIDIETKTELEIIEIKKEYSDFINKETESNET